MKLLLVIKLSALEVFTGWILKLLNGGTIMFEEMLREMLLKLIREDTVFQAELISIIDERYNRTIGKVAQQSVRQLVKLSLENDKEVQDAVRKQATLDVGELIVEMIDHDENVINSIRSVVQDKIDDFTFEVIVR